MTDQEKTIEAEELATKSALLALKKDKNFSVYEGEIRKLCKTLILTIVRTKPLTKEEAQKIIFMQGQLDILMGVYGMTLDTIINETVDEQFTESSE